MSTNSIICGDNGLKYSGSISPNTVTEDSQGKHVIPFSALNIANGRIFIEGAINAEMLSALAMSMLSLADEGKEVTIYINSGGGEVTAGLGIYDIIKSYPYHVTMYCTALAGSMAAVILAGGQKGRRFILPHSKVMIHEPLISGGFGGSASTIEKTAKSILELRAITNGIIAESTGKTLEEINAATVFDNYMNAEEAVKFGICDEIRNLF